ncbi:MAG: prepilin peptidase [Propionibacterium sp.]|nr:prepilin peptidase [Propionibacterium sp.]
MDPADPPPDYTALARPWDAVLLGIVAFGSACALWRVPPVQLPLWFGYLGAGGALVWVDLKTTWLPKRLHWVATAQVGAGLALVACASPGVAASAIAGAFAASGLLWLVWRFSRSFGFGDVRLGLLVGATAGSMGLQPWGLALVSGTLIGALWALIHALRGRASEPFPYGPALWLGPLAAAILTSS